MLHAESSDRLAPLCFRHYNDDLRICFSLVEQSSHRDEIKNLAYVPFANEVTTQGKRLLVIEKIVLLQHAQHTAVDDHFHGLMQEQVRKLLIWQHAIRSVVALVAA